MNQFTFESEKNENTSGSNFNTIAEAKNDLILNYTNPGHPIAFSGVNTIYKYYKAQLTKKQILDILSTIESYTLHRGYRSSQRNPSYSHFKRYMFQMDLVFLTGLEKYNDNVKYLLTVIDTFTRFAWIRMLKDKMADTVLNAFKSIINEAGSKPLHIVMDRG